MNLYGTRQFRSLGLWCLLRHLGFEGYRAHLSGLVACARQLRRMLEEDARYVLLPQRGHMPIVCFRVAGGDREESDSYTRALVEECHARDLAYPTLLRWRSQPYVRVAIGNYSTTAEHMAKLKHVFDSVLAELIERGVAHHAE